MASVTKKTLGIQMAKFHSHSKILLRHGLLCEALLKLGGTLNSK